MALLFFLFYSIVGAEIRQSEKELCSTINDSSKGTNIGKDKSPSKPSPMNIKFPHLPQDSYFLEE